MSLCIFCVCMASQEGKGLEEADCLPALACSSGSQVGLDHVSNYLRSVHERVGAGLR